MESKQKQQTSQKTSKVEHVESREEKKLQGNESLLFKHGRSNAFRLQCLQKHFFVPHNQFEAPKKV